MREPAVTRLRFQILACTFTTTPQMQRFITTSLKLTNREAGRITIGAGCHNESITPFVWRVLAGQRDRISLARFTDVLLLIITSAWSNSSRSSASGSDPTSLAQSAVRSAD
jgi:hypothetical protein